MAQKLHDTYKFNYDNLKVLLGGWNTWKQENEKDPTGYPIGGTGIEGGANDKAPVELQPAPAVTVVTP